jgi:hypothetical protein
MSIVLSQPATSEVESPAALIEQLPAADKLDRVMYRFTGTVERLTANLDPVSFQKILDSIVVLIREVKSARQAQRKTHALGFTVCGNYFPVHIASEPLEDADGREAWAITDPVAGEILIWEKCPRHEWLHTVMHEFHRVWCLYHHEPADQTEGAMNFANECGEFNRQFADQGGMATLLALKPRQRKRRPRRARRLLAESQC